MAMTPRENYMALHDHGKPEHFVNQYEAFGFSFDPLIMKIVGNRKQGTDSIDPWGVTIRWPMGVPAGIPHITEETKVIKDITEWKKYVHAPSLEMPKEAWDKAREMTKSFDRNKQLLTCFMATGLFEQSHYLMGFEDTLMNLLLEPEAMGELLDYILEWKMEYAHLIIENLHPDVILSHDDWGAKDRLFMQPDTWRELFKPRYAKLYGYIKSQGVQVVHHADSYCREIANDMIDVGIDVWQGVLPSNNIPALQKELKGDLLLMGGLDAGKIDVEGWTREMIADEVAKACREYYPGGGFIPCITYGTPESVFPGVFETITEEINKQSAIYFK